MNPTKSSGATLANLRAPLFPALPGLEDVGLELVEGHHLFRRVRVETTQERLARESACGGSGVLVYTGTIKILVNGRTVYLLYVVLADDHHTVV